MPKKSAGVLVYRNDLEKGVLVLLVHPGGPFFKKKDDGVWSIPKGEYEDGEDPLEAAKREFKEETGTELSEGPFIELNPVKLKSGKVIKAFAVEGSFEMGFIKSNQFSMEWPPKSGKLQSFDEVDKADWFSFNEARIKITAGQIPILDQLESILKTSIKS